MTIEIPLTQGYVALIDEEDAELVLSRNWHAKVRNTSLQTKVYAGTNIIRDKDNWRAGYRWVMLHRFLLGEPEGEVDHINGNGLDNRRSNLRVCTHGENMRNRRAYGVSSYLGVGFDGDARQKPWSATIGKSRVGRFRSEEEAARAYDAAASEKYGDFARLNFPVRGAAEA